MPPTFIGWNISSGSVRCPQPERKSASITLLNDRMR